MENSTKINMPTLKADDIIEKAAVIRAQELDTLINNMADSLSKASSGKNLSKYWKTQDELIKDVITSYKTFNKESNKNNATELIKTTNALKAIAGVDLSNILPDFDEFTKSFNNAKKKVGNLDSAFNVKGFKEVFDVFNTLEQQGLDVQEVFSHFGVSSDISKLQQNVRSLEEEVENLTKRLLSADDAKDALQKELDDIKIGSGFADKLDELDRLKAEMQNIRNEAILTFNQFLEANKIDKYDWFNNDRFAEYFEKLENGKLTASDAIRQFKTEYDYLLEESFKSNGNSFGLDQLQAFSTKLDSIFHQVEETSNKINDILSNGVIAKSVQNLSEDTTLSDSQRSIFGNILQDEESLKSITALFQKLIDETNQTKNTEVFNTEQFTKIESLFTSIESSLSSIKGVLVDVGDGEELSPLLKTIANIESAIDNLSSSIKGIGLNMNIDFGSDTEMEAKAQAKISNALQAYQNLFDHIKMSSAGGSLITQKFFDFDINQFDTPMSKLQAYIKFIKDMREETKKMFGGQDVLKIDTDDKYWNRASAAMGQVKKTFNEMKATNDTNPLENIFGKTDLTEVISQLENIVSKLDEISVSAKGFTETFKNGLNVNASVEEIEKLTNRVKELEDELARVKAPTTLPSEESNTLSGSSQVKISDNITDQIIKNEKKKQDAYKATTEMVMYHAGIISKLNKAETNGQFYGSDRNTGYFGTGHYFVDANTKHELDDNDYYSSLPYTSIDISKYDNLFKATSDEVADALHTFLKNLTKFTQGSDSFEVSELFSQFQKVFGETTMDMQEFDAKLSQLKAYMQSSNMFDRGDSVSTQFMKSLGYGGVDTRGTNYADTRYGTVIYDLKEESILQSNITDELQKQGQMLEKINYEKGQVFDKSEDAKIQNILDQQAKSKEIEAEFNKIFDSTNLNTYENELESVNQKLSENQNIIDNCNSAIKLAEEDAREYARDMAEIGKPIPDEKLNEIVKNNKVEYQERIEELSKEQSLLKDRKQEIESNLDAEYKLANAARERATATVEDRTKDAFPNAATKLDEAVTSAKDLDNILNQVDIPTDSFDKVLEKLDRTKSELVDIVKITKQSVSDADGKFHDSYTLKDSRGSTEIYGMNSKTDKGQILRQNIVGYNVKKDTVDNSKELLAIEKQLQEEIETSDKANQKKFQDFQKEQVDYVESVNKVNSAIQKTDEILDTLPLHDKLDSQFLDMIDSVDNLNSKLKSGELTLSEYKNEVKSVTSEYSKMVSIQQKRDVEDYNANAKANLDNTKNIQAEWDKNLKAIQDYMDAVTKLNNLKASDKGLGTRTTDIEAQQKKIDDMKSSFESAQTTLLSFFSSTDKFNSLPVSSIKEVQDAIKLIQTAANGSTESISRLEDALRNMQETSIGKLEKTLSNYRGKVSGYEALIKKFGDDGWTSPEYLDNVQRAQQVLEAYEDKVNKLKENPELVNKESLADVEKLGKDFEKVTLSIKNMTAAQKGYTQLGAEKAMDKISQMLKENSKMSRQAKADIKAWYDQIASGNPSASLDVILGKVEAIVRAEKDAGRGGKSMWDAIKEKAWYGVASTIGTYFGLNDIIRYGKEGIDIVREFDTALTEMRKVSDESVQSLKNYQSTTFDTADAVGTTAKQIQESTADYMRLGESLDEASESAKTANILLNVSEFDNIEDATKSLVSMGQAYKDLDKMTIVDKLNEVGKNYCPNMQ